MKGKTFCYKTSYSVRTEFMMSFGTAATIGEE
jgi:hypothetical protein